MIAFMFLFPARCADVAEARGMPFEEVLSTRSQDAGDFWVRLRDADAELES